MVLRSAASGPDVLGFGPAASECNADTSAPIPCSNSGFMQPNCIPSAVDISMIQQSFQAISQHVAALSDYLGAFKQPMGGVQAVTSTHVPNASVNYMSPSPGVVPPVYNVSVPNVPGSVYAAVP